MRATRGSSPGASTEAATIENERLAATAASALLESIDPM
jgi:hypothetical protein